MSDQVYSLAEARDWFRDHPNGHVMCVNKSDFTQRYCKTYIEAQSFFWEELEAEERSIELIKNTPSGDPAAWSAWQESRKKP